MIDRLLRKSPRKLIDKMMIHDKLKILFQHDTERTLNICFLWKTKPALNVLLLSAFPISLFYAQRTLRDTLDSTSPNCFQFEDGLARHQTNRLVGYTLVRWVTVRVSAATKRQTSYFCGADRTENRPSETILSALPTQRWARRSARKNVCPPGKNLSKMIATKWSVARGKQRSHQNNCFQNDRRRGKNHIF